MRGRRPPCPFDVLGSGAAVLRASGGRDTFGDRWVLGALGGDGFEAQVWEGASEREKLGPGWRVLEGHPVSQASQ